MSHFTKRIHAKFVFIAVELILHSGRNVYKDTMSRYTKGKSESLQNVFVGEVHQHMFCVGNDEQIEDCLQFCDACPSSMKTITANKGGKAKISGWWLWINLMEDIGQITCKQTLRLPGGTFTLLFASDERITNTSLVR